MPNKRKLTNDLDSQLRSAQLGQLYSERARNNMEMLTFAIFIFTGLITAVSLGTLMLMKETIQNPSLIVGIMPWLILVAYVFMVVILYLKYKSYKKLDNFIKEQVRETLAEMVNELEKKVERINGQMKKIKKG